MKRLLFASLCLLAIGCGFGNRNNPTRFEVPTPNMSLDIEQLNRVWDSTEVVDFTEIYSKPLPNAVDIIESIEIVPLETSEASVIGHIDNFLTTGEYIYVFDGNGMGSVLIFNIDGTFLKRIPSGEGPGELTYPWNIYYSKQDSCLYVDDNMKHSILKYTSDGNYVATYRLNEDFDNFFIDNGFLMLAKSLITGGADVFQLKREDTILFRTLDTLSLGRFKSNLPRCGNIQPYGNGWDIWKDNVVYRFINNRLCRRFVFTSDIDLVFLGLYAESKDIQHTTLMWAATGAPSSIYRNKNNGLVWERKSGLNNILFGLSRIGVHDAEHNIFCAELSPSFLLGSKIDGAKWDGDSMNGLISEPDMQRLRMVKDDDNPLIVFYKIQAD